MNYAINVFDSVTEAFIVDRYSLTLKELESLLTDEPTITADKDSVKLFNLVDLKTLEEGAELGRRHIYVNGERTGEYELIEGTVRRCKANAKSIGGIILDVDEHMTIEQAIDAYDGIHFILYTTHRHSLAKHKFRVIIPFSQPLLVEDIPAREASIRATFPGVDNASFTVSQAFYFHSTKPDSDDSVAFAMSGVVVDPYDFEVAQVPVVNYAPVTAVNDVDSGYRDALVANLQQCSNVHYDHIAGVKNGGVLTLVAICKSIGLSFEEFDSICVQIAAKDSTLMRQDVRRMAWTGFEGNRITKEKRDAFLVANGSHSFKMTARDLRPKVYTKYQNTLKIY